MNNGQQIVVYDRIMGHTFKEVRNLAKRHGVSLGYDGSTKSGAAMRIVSQLDYEGYDYEVFMSIVETPSSYMP